MSVSNHLNLIPPSDDNPAFLNYSMISQRMEDSLNIFIGFEDNIREITRKEQARDTRSMFTRSLQKKDDKSRIL